MRDLSIMYCLPLGLSNVSTGKVKNSLRAFTRCLFIKQNTFTFNASLVSTCPNWIFQQLTVTVNSMHHCLVFFAVKHPKWYYLHRALKTSVCITVCGPLPLSFIPFCSACAGHYFLFLITSIYFQHRDLRWPIIEVYSLSPLYSKRPN